MPGLVIHKLADKSQPVPRPLLGVRLENPPDKARVPTNVVTQAVAEGWASMENPTPVVRPAGPTQDQLFSTQSGEPHTFVHADAVVFHTVDGDIRYKVVHQPDKYADHDARTWEMPKFKGGDDVSVTPEIYENGATRVDHFYDLVKES